MAQNVSSKLSLDLKKITVYAKQVNENLVSIDNNISNIGSNKGANKQTADFSKLSDSVKSTTDAIEKLTKTMQGIDSNTKNTSNSIDKIVRAFEAMNNTAPKTKRNTDALRDLNKAFKANVDTIKDLDNKITRLESIKKRLSIDKNLSDISRANTEINRLKATLSSLNAAAGGNNNLNKLLKTDPQSLTEIKSKIAMLEKYRQGMNITTAKGKQDNEVILAQISKLTDKVKELNAISKPVKTEKQVAGLNENTINQINLKLKEYKRLRDSVAVSELHPDGGRKIDVYNKKIQDLTNRVKELRKVESAKTTGLSISGLTDTKDLNTYAKRAERIKQIRNAIQNLDETDKRYNANLKNLLNTYQKLNSKNRTYNSQLRTTHNQTQRLFSITEQLKRQMGFMFGIASLMRYTRMMVKTTGEFQLQHVALTAIIRDADKANLLFNQLQGLAVKSPFQFKQLATYTKQLAAFQFEAKDLYKTMKMLGDISAGVGVGMDRLILALGQVKAANYLRGTELRQFTEAGINILGLLADKYSEIQNRAISTADVMEMVSKRMVSYTDVYDVLNNLTEENGMFFNAQALQAETLAGKLSNLRDNLDIMFNKLGNQDAWAILPTVDAITGLIKNFRVLIPIINGVALAFTIAHLNSLKFSKSAIMQVAANEKEIHSLSRLERAYYKLHKAKLTAQATGIKATGMGALGVAGITLGAIAGVYSAYRQLNLEYKESIEIFDSIYNINDKQYNKIKETVAEYKKIEKLSENIKKNNSKYNSTELIEEQNRLEAEKYSLLEDIEIKYADINDKLAENLTLQQRIQAIEDVNQIVSDLSVLSVDTADFFDPIGANTFAEALQRISERTNDIQLKTKIAKINYERFVNILQKEIDKTGDTGLQKMLDDLQNVGFEKFQTNTRLFADYYVKNISKANDSSRKLFELLGQLSISFGNLGKSRIKKGGMIRDLEEINELIDKYIEAEPEFKKAAQEMMNSSDEAISNSLSKLGIGFNNYITSLKEDLSPQAKQVLEDMFEEKYGFKVFVDIVPKGGKDKDPIRGFRKQVNDYVEAHPLAIKALIDADPNEAEDLKELYKTLSEGLTFKSMDDDRIKFYQNLEKQIKRTKTEIKELETAERNRFDNFENIGKDNSGLLDEFKTTLATLEDIKKKFWGIPEDEKKGNTAAKKYLTDRIALIKEAQARYKKLLDVFKPDVANKKVKESFEEAYTNLNMAHLLEKGFDDTGVIQQFKGLYKTLNDMGKKGRDKLDKEISKIDATVEYNVRIENIESVEKDLEDLFKGYKLSVSLDDMEMTGIDLQGLFGTDTINLDTLKDALSFVQKQMDVYGKYGTKWVDVYKKFSKQIEDIERERLKKSATEYNEYLRTIMGETGTIIDKYRKKDASVNFLLDKGKITEGEKQAYDYFSNIQKKAELAKIDWDKLMNTPLMLDAFSNTERFLSTGLQDMIDMLEKFQQDSAGSLSVSDMRQLNKQIQDLKDNLDKVSGVTWKGLFDKTKSDFKTLFGLKDSLKEIDTLKAKLTDLQKEEVDIKVNITDYQEVGEKLKTEIEKLSSEITIDKFISKETTSKLAKTFGGKFEDMSIVDKQKAVSTLKPEDGVYTQEELDLLSDYLLKLQELDVLQSKLRDNTSKLAQSNVDLDKNQKKQTENQQKQSDITTKLNNTIKNLGKNYKALKGGLESVQTVVGNVTQTMKDLRTYQKAVGGSSFISEDSVAFMEDFGTAIGFAVNGFVAFLGVIPLIQTGLATLEAHGIALNTIFAPLLIIVAAVAAAAAVFAIARQHDRDLDKQIKKQQEDVKKLKKAYDDLDKQLEKSFNLENMRKFSAEMKGNLQQQKSDYERMAAMERSKKDRDLDKAKEYEEKIDEINEKMIEQQEDMMSRLGVLDMAGAVEDFTSAWADAYYAGENTLDALEKKFDEFIRNAVMKQAANKIIGSFLDPVNKELEKSLSDLEISPEEMANIQKLAIDAMNGSNVALRQFYESLNQFPDIAADSLSGLQKGIQSVTEETAEAVESLLNSMRLDVYGTYQSSLQIQTILSSDDSNVNPILSEIRNTNNILNTILSRMDSVIMAGHSLGGDSLKVMID